MYTLHNIGKLLPLNSIILCSYDLRACFIAASPSPPALSVLFACVLISVWVFFPPLTLVSRRWFFRQTFFLFYFTSFFPQLFNQIPFRSQNVLCVTSLAKRCTLRLRTHATTLRTEQGDAQQWKKASNAKKTAEYNVYKHTHTHWSTPRQGTHARKVHGIRWKIKRARLFNSDQTTAKWSVAGTRNIVVVSLINVG